MGDSENTDNADSANSASRRRLVRKGTPEYTRALRALFAIGLATMAMLYAVQPILATIGAEFNVPASQTALLMSATTLTVAVFVLVWGTLGTKIGERRVIIACLYVAVGVSLIIPFAQNWTMLIIGRALQGIALAGPATAAIAWVSRNVFAPSVAKVAGLYIAGTTVGGMSGRLLSGFFTEMFNWRVGVGSVVVFGMIFSVAAHLMLPKVEGQTKKRKLGVESPWRRRQRLLSYIFGFVGMGVFVGIYNVLGYRISIPPWNMGTGLGSTLFLSYLAGTFSSSKAGDLSRVLGTKRLMLFGWCTMVVGVLLTIPNNVITLWAGLLILSAGFFGMHSIASARASFMHPNNSMGSGLYLFNYYLGSSFGAIAMGFAWDHGQWTSVMYAAAGALLVVLVIVLSVSNRDTTTS